MTSGIHVVVADDSPFICRLLTQYLESDPDIRVVGTAMNGKEAVHAVKKWHPDVLTLDLNMPVLSGLNALGQIMAESPVPVVLISGVSREAAQMTSTGLSLGAVDFIFKYSPAAAIPPDSLRREIIARVKTAARVKVIRHIPPIRTRKRKPGIDNVQFSIPNFQLNGKSGEVGPRIFRSRVHAPKIVIIGASTGGPLSLKDLLTVLGKPENIKRFSFPLVIVQHMPEGFTTILAEQFNRLFPFPVWEARDGEPLYPRTVVIAPGNRHLLVRPDGVIQTSMTPPINGHRPSIDVTMQSAAHVFGSYTAGVILSGMGDDGCRGLLAIRNNCGNTFAQSMETCVIDTMPVSAIEKGIVQQVGSPADIGQWLCNL